MVADDENGDEIEGEFTPARFAVEFAFPVGDMQTIKDAAPAVRQEYQDCSRWKRLRCEGVSVFAEHNRGTVFVVHVGQAVEFDWTWEGATAFRPNVSEGVRTPDDLYAHAEIDHANVWSGEILEVDERGGRLFICLEDADSPPTVGTFFVRPYEFLAVLNAIYNENEFAEVRQRLPSRLAAAAGEIHLPVAGAISDGLSALQSCWQYSWCALWGPPGTGKTHTTGQQVARVLSSKRERILVISTTNRATDSVALKIGEAAQTECPGELARGGLLRIGKGAAYQKFAGQGLEAMLHGTESASRGKLDSLREQLPLLDSWEDKALARKQIGELRSAGKDQSHRIFIDPAVDVVVATAFKAMSFLSDDLIRSMIEKGEAPFTTIFIDEAGLMSRAAVAALSLLASRRVVLVGDSKQLAPISRITRVLPTRQQKWLASSGLSHLDDIQDPPAAVHVLREQWRMHPDVCEVVSHFQYHGILTTAPARVVVASQLSPLIADFSRAIWYVLDEEGADLASIRASRGPGNRSWVRAITPSVLQKFFQHDDLRDANGLFISPFKAQARAVADLLARWKIPNWEASTVHSQQGSEADVVIFDTVNAGSYNWPYDEWKRLVNVAISRAREAIIVLASRSEMEEPYLRPLRSRLRPAVLGSEKGTTVWRDLDGSSTTERTANNYDSAAPEVATCVGDQIAQRKALTPIFSQEQQRLTNLQLDGKPRLVRGVAGSGKSVVLCNWLAKTALRMEGQPGARIWAVFANRSLQRLLRESIESAWESLTAGDLQRREFPWHCVDLMHLRDVLDGLLPSVGLSTSSYGFNYDEAADAFLNAPNSGELLPRCTALFIDEAQDMGPAALRLLLSIVEQTDKEDANSRSAHIFYDNAQNVYGTKTPTWSEFGIDLRGRSTIMRESFRSTRPITELAVNVLSRLADESRRADQQELLSMKLLEQGSRGGQPWLNVRFNEVDGAHPIYRLCASRDVEMQLIGDHLQHLIQRDGVSPRDICIIYNGQAQQVLDTQLAPRLTQFDVELSIQKNRPFERQSRTLVATSAHSYKGYESEVVIIPCVDCFIAPGGKILANSLYVAMTRARSFLAIYGGTGSSAASRRLDDAIGGCITQLDSPPDVDLSELGPCG